MHISTRAGCYSTTEDALADVAAFLIWLKRMCAKNNYACVCYAGVSEYDDEKGSILCGKRGKKEFIPKGKRRPQKIDPHIHIVLLANPAETLAKKSLAFFAKRGKSGWHKDCESYLEDCMPYAMRQSIKYRTTSYNVDQFDEWTLDRFLKITELENKRMYGCSPIFKGISDSYFNEDFEIDLFTLWGLRTQGKPASLPTIKAVSVRSCRSTM